MGRLIRLDWAIKKILRDKANFDILEGFLTELLGFEVRIRQILESESNRENAHDRSNRVDLLAENEEGQLIIIEVQNETEADYLQRLMYGTAKAMVDHIDKGEPYFHIRKIYSVSIVYFDLGKGEDYLYHGTTSFKGLRRSDELELTDSQKALFDAKGPANLFPEYFIIKVPKYDDKIRDTLDEWVFFLKNEEVPDGFRARGLSAAREKLDVMKMSDEERARYNAYMEDLRYQASMLFSTYTVGKHEGEKKGHHNALTATARRMLAAGFDPKQIAEMTGLSFDEIRALK